MDELENVCRYRINGVHCRQGFLADSKGELVSFDNSVVAEKQEAVACPACNGDEFLLTSSGKKILNFMKRRMEPIVREQVMEILKRQGLMGI